MVGVKSARRDAINEDHIAKYVRRFGPLTTSQVSTHFGYRTRDLSKRLARIPGLVSEELPNKSLLWKSAN